MNRAATLDDQVSLLSALSDTTRLRLLALLEDHELSVVELTQIMELGQSKVSTHLSRLRDQGLLADRKSGTSTYYRLNASALSPTAERLWATLRGAFDDVTLERDQTRAQQVVEAREKKTWPERMAGELERHYSPGRTWEALARAFASLVRAGEVLDVGAGDGTVAEMVAPRATRYVCVDASMALSRAAQARVLRLPNASVMCADMHALPFAQGRFDQVLMLNVLTYADKPAQAVDDAVRVLAPGGELLLVTVARHEHLEVAAQYGHKQPGFEPRWLKKRLQDRGMRVLFCEITSRERQRPHFEIITCLARKSP